MSTSKIKRKIPEVFGVSSQKNVMTFNLKNINFSFVNAIRRTILSDIPIPVFKTSPYKENKCIITKNTSRLNNEILKQRLSCIPIHIKDITSVDNLELVIEKENTTDSVIYVTTDDFQLRDLTTEKFLSKDETLKIFPPDPFTKDHILFARLRPKITKTMKGEEISLTCKLSVSTASDNGAFNVVSTCSYNFEDDVQKQKLEWHAYEKTLEDKSDIKIKKQNWFNHKAKRFYKDDSFNFILETIGIYTNIDIVKKACDIINDKLDVIKDSLKNNSLITSSINTINNSYDIKLVQESYTIGKIIEYILHEDYYKNGPELSYVGFNKKHPHNKYSIIRLAFRNEDDATIDNVKSIMDYSITQCKTIINNINESFG